MQEIQVPAMSRQTFLLLRAIGYCLLVLFLLDFFALIIPLEFTNATWELTTYGQVVERVPLLLLSFPLVFFGEYSARMKWEQLTTKIISWTAFIMAVFFFLGIPLVVINTFRVQDIRQAEVITKSVQQTIPVQAIADSLNKANTDNEVRNVLKSLNPQLKPSTVQIPKPQEVKKKILAEINTSINQSQAQANDIKRRISTALWKDSIKWAIAAFLSGLFLLYVWLQSKWARVGINY